LAVMLVGGLLVFAWIERRAATGRPIQLPALPDVELPLHGRGVLFGEIAILGVGVLIIVFDLAILQLLV
jgi:hypothetical protein